MQKADERLAPTLAGTRDIGHIDTAERTFTRAQLVTLALIPLAAIVCVWLIGWLALLVTLVGSTTLLYIAVMVSRAQLVRHPLAALAAPPLWGTQASDDEAWPVYTILVPLYREGRVLPGLLAHLNRLDYPREQLQVLLLLEADDSETMNAAAALEFPDEFEVIVVEPSHPRTKPKACNLGLRAARGEYCVVFDAEDRPELDQLKKAVRAFRASGSRVACIQARLAYANGSTNALTRLFAAEYATYFDLVLPGLARLHMPVPLGGTSNHFPTALLRAVGGWDAYNVTEDLDLGMRLARAGLDVAMLDSVTWEEANSRVGNWIRQRSRWIKGHIQTYFVHMRSPVALWRDLGFAKFVTFQLLILATPLTLALNPVFWLLTAIYAATRASLIEAVYPAPVFYVAVTCLVAGNVLFLFYTMTGCMRRGVYGSVKWVLIGSFFYWILMSVATWKAIYQIATKPHFWEKSEHGLDLQIWDQQSSDETNPAAATGAGVMREVVPPHLTRPVAERAANREHGTPSIIEISAVRASHAVPASFRSAAVTDPAYALGGAPVSRVDTLIRAVAPTSATLSLANLANTAARTGYAAAGNGSRAAATDGDRLRSITTGATSLDAISAPRPALITAVLRRRLTRQALVLAATVAGLAGVLLLALAPAGVFHNAAVSAGGNDAPRADAIPPSASRVVQEESFGSVAGLTPDGSMRFFATHCADGILTVSTTTQIFYLIAPCAAGSTLNDGVRSLQGQLVAVRASGGDTPELTIHRAGFTGTVFVAKEIWVAPIGAETAR